MYRLIQDNDCHWYVIDVKDEAEFEKWIAYCEDDGPVVLEYTGKHFDDNRIDGPHRLSFPSYEIEK